MVPRILTHNQKQCRLYISSDLLHNAEMFHGVITGDEMWRFQTTRTQNHRACRGKHTSAEKNTHVLVTGQHHACVLLQSQGDS